MLLWGIWGDAQDQVFAVGDLGTILHHRGHWRALEKQTTDHLQAISGNDADDIVVVGFQGLVLRKQGESWSSERVEQHPFGDVWLAPSGEIYVIRNGMAPGAAIDMHDGSRWVEDKHISSSFLFAIWGTGTGEVVAAGYDVIEHWTPMSFWTTYTTSTIGLDVWGSGASDIYVVGKSGRIEYFDGQGWTPDTSSGVTEDLHGVWGRSQSEVFIVGAQGTVLKGARGNWQVVDSATGMLLWGIWGDAQDQVFAVGEGGTITHYDGSAFEPTVTGTSAPLDDIWGADLENLYVVGGEGTILQWCNTP
jgi:hypothetical protein